MNEKQAQAWVLFHNIIIISYNMFLLVSTMHIFLNFAIVGREVRNGFFEYSFKQYTAMKEFLETMEKDYQKESFTMKEIVVFGVIAPIVILAALAII